MSSIKLVTSKSYKLKFLFGQVEKQKYSLVTIQVYH